MMIQGIHRYLSEETILLDLDERLAEPEGFADFPARRKDEFKREVLKIMVEQLDRTGAIVNPTKCLTDLFNRELKATTGLGAGIAMPHVRTMQARSLRVAVLCTRRGLYFNALDGAPTHVFFGMVCPPYEDQKYLELVAAVSRFARGGQLLETVMAAKTPAGLMGEFCRQPSA